MLEDWIVHFSNMFLTVVTYVKRKKVYTSLKQKLRGCSNKQWNILRFLPADSLNIIKQEISYDKKSF